MTLVSLDCASAGGQARAFDVNYGAEVFDRADVVLWRPRASLRRYLGDPRVGPPGDGESDGDGDGHSEGSFVDEQGDRDLPVLSSAASNRLLADARRWRAAFAGLLERGGMLVACADAGMSAGVHTMQEVITFDCMEILPGGPLATQELASPCEWIARCGAPFDILFDRLGPILEARVSIDNPEAMPLLVDANGHQVFATYRYLRPGHLLILPALIAPDAASIVPALAGLFAALSGDDAGDTASPRRFSSENKLIDAIAAHRYSMRSLQAEIDRLDLDRRRFGAVRTLLWTDGRPARLALQTLLKRAGALPDSEEGAAGELVAATLGNRRYLFQVMDQDQVKVMAEHPPPGAASMISRRALAGLAFSPDPPAALLGLLDPQQSPALSALLEQRMDEELTG